MTRHDKNKKEVEIKEKDVSEIVAAVSKHDIPKEEHVHIKALTKKEKRDAEETKRGSGHSAKSHDSEPHSPKLKVGDDVNSLIAKQKSGEALTKREKKIVAAHNHAVNAAS